MRGPSFRGRGVPRPGVLAQTRISVFWPDKNEAGFSSCRFATPAKIFGEGEAGSRLDRLCCAKVPKAGIGPTAAALVCKHASRSGRSEEYPLRVRAAKTPPVVLSRWGFAFWVIAAAWCPPSAQQEPRFRFTPASMGHISSNGTQHQRGQAEKEEQCDFERVRRRYEVRFRSAHLHVGELLDHPAGHLLTQTVCQASPIDRGILASTHLKRAATRSSCTVEAGIISGAASISRPCLVRTRRCLTS